MMNPSYTLPDTPDFFQTTSQFPDVFTPRQAESHKGTYGTLAVVGGALFLGATARLDRWEA